MNRAINYRRIANVAVASLALPAALLGQQANASAAAFGMGSNYTAAARGFDVVAWNPALLGLPGNPKFSIGGLAVSSNAGGDPITLADFAEHAGATIPTSVRQRWIADVRAAGTQEGSADGGMNFVAFSKGSFAASVSASGAGTMSMNADAMEMLLLGNADAVAANRTLAPTGGGSGSGFVTTAVSWGKALNWKPTGKDGEHVSFGLTGKWVLGMGHASAATSSSTLSADALTLRLPVVYSVGADAGSGLGFDLGAAWHAGNTTLGVTVMNVFNTFAWSKDGFTCRNISADVTSANISTNTDEVPCSTAAVSGRVNAATELGFKPAIRAGLAWSGRDNLTLTADIQSQMGSETESIILGPKFAAGVGAEYTGIKVLALRAGAGMITGGTQVSGGAGLRLGRFELGAGAQMRSADGVSSTNLMFGLGYR